MTQSKLPPSASIATSGDDGRMCAPSAERNAEPICAVLRDHAPKSGRALELASGTGQHSALFAAALPGLIWQPTEVDAARLRSIEAWRAKACCDNLNPPLFLDAARRGWSSGAAKVDLILVINLFHLITDVQARTLVAEASQALQKHGVLMIYGPFLRDGQATSAGDRVFHAELRAADPKKGYKDVQDIERWMQEANLVDLQTLQMPANNLILKGIKR